MGKGLLVFGLVGCGGGIGSDETTLPSPATSVPDVSTSGNQSGSVTEWCCDCGARTTLALDEVGPGGFSAQDTFDANGPIDGDLAWADAVLDTVHVEITADTEDIDGGGLEWVDATEGDCEDFLWIPVWLSVSTGDGALAETLRTSLLAYAPDRWHTGGSTYGDLLVGTLDLTRFEPTVQDQNATVYFLVDEVPAASGEILLDPRLGSTVSDSSTTTSSSSSRRSALESIATWIRQ